MSSIICSQKDVDEFKEKATKASVVDTLRGQALKFIDTCKTVTATEAKEAEKGGKKGKRKASERMTWMGKCMRKKENGGDGKSMSECATTYKKDHPKKEDKK
jgi:hypothetical protein